MPKTIDLKQVANELKEAKIFDPISDQVRRDMTATAELVKEGKLSQTNAKKLLKKLADERLYWKIWLASLKH